GLSGDEAARVAGEQQKGTVEFVETTHAPHGGVALEPAHGVLAGEHLLGLLAGEPPRCDRVDPNPALRPLGPELTGEVGNTALGRAAGGPRQRPGAGEPQDRGDVDDRSTPFPHGTGRQHAHLEGGGQVHVESASEILDRVLQGGYGITEPGGVDQDVRATQCHGPFDDPLVVRARGHITGLGHDPAVGTLELCQPFGTAGSGDDDRPGVGQKRAEMASDTAGGAGDHGHRSAQVRCDAHGRRSMMVALAMPPPAHMVCNPDRPPLRSNSCSKVTISFAPEAPNGCPKEMPPPLTLTRSASTPSSRCQATTTGANASLTSNRSMSLAFIPARSRTVRVAGMGADNIITGSSPTTLMWRTAARGRNPRCSATWSAMRSTAADPSTIWEELPAVTRPSGTKDGLSPASASNEVVSRMHSSWVSCVPWTFTAPVSR